MRHFYRLMLLWNNVEIHHIDRVNNTVLITIKISRSDMEKFNNCRYIQFQLEPERFAKVSVSHSPGVYAQQISNERVKGPAVHALKTRSI